MDPPASDDEVKPENLEEAKEGGPLFHCDLLDTEIVHKIAQALLPGLASACIDNTTGGLFRTPASVAVDIRRDMVDYLFQRSENFVAESVVLQGGPDAEVSDHPYDIISEFIDDFVSSKRNFFSRVSGWLLSERREDRIDDFVQEMELNGFWLMGRREAVAQTLVKNVDVKNTFHCDMKFKSPEELAEHFCNCRFREMDCMNEGCNSRFSAGQADYHDSVCPFKILPCEQKCSANIMRRDMDRHCITVCPMKLAKCPFYTVGCQFTVPQSTIDQHRSDYLNSHLFYILQPVYKEASVEDLNRRVEQLETISSSRRLAAARDPRSLTYLIRDLEAKLGPLQISSKAKDCEEGEELNGKKEESPKKEEYINPPKGKDEGLESPTKHIQCMDPSPEKSAASSPKHQEIGNVLDEKEELTGSSTLEDKSLEPPIEREILKEQPAGKEEEKEATMPKVVHVESPTKGN
ncbi:unnamed protein product [Coffea canephora]|uniref:TRAF-type domain-containing protein n=1 Tax=Coffea canephora TaxID=49390 RepID=A0A068U841_COFCA|nr:unnamed protein product [Coffea canephora]